MRMNTRRAAPFATKELSLAFQEYLQVRQDDSSSNTRIKNMVGPAYDSLTSELEVLTALSQSIKDNTGKLAAKGIVVKHSMAEAQVKDKVSNACTLSLTSAAAYRSAPALADNSQRKQPLFDCNTIKREGQCRSSPVRLQQCALHANTIFDKG